MQTEFTIEAMREQGGYWYILGSERSSASAQNAMAEYRNSFPKLPLRVVESGSRRLIVLNDPR